MWKDFFGNILCYIVVWLVCGAISGEISPVIETKLGQLQGTRHRKNYDLGQGK